MLQVPVLFHGGTWPVFMAARRASWVMPGSFVVLRLFWRRTSSPSVPRIASQPIT